MKLPCYHSFDYKGHPLIYMNGPYKIADMAYPPFDNINAAKAKIDEYERLNGNEPKFFDNLKSTNGKKTTVGY